LTWISSLNDRAPRRWRFRPVSARRPAFLRRLPARPGRVAVLSVHTSPLEQPGTGDAGGMNVYIEQTALRMARRGVAVEIFTRATSSELPPVVELAPGVTVRHVVAGPFEGLDKSELPAQLCAFSAAVLRAEAFHEPGYYDVIHSHYWLSGQVGWLARERWGVPLVHTAHTLARVKNAALAVGATSATTVLERRSEIGLMKALGASHRAVGSFFIAEQLLLALVGGALGYAIGIVLARVLGIGIFGIAPTLRWILFPVVLALAAVVAFLGSLAPLARASRADPAPVLRGE